MVCSTQHPSRIFALTVLLTLMGSLTGWMAPASSQASSLTESQPLLLSQRGQITKLGGLDELYNPSGGEQEDDGEGSDRSEDGSLENSESASGEGHGERARRGSFGRPGIEPRPNVIPRQ